VIVKVWHGMVIRSSGASVAWRNSMNEAGHDDEFLIHALRQLIMDLSVTNEVIGAHRVK